MNLLPKKNLINRYSRDPENNGSTKKLILTDRQVDQNQFIPVFSRKSASFSAYVFTCFRKTALSKNGCCRFNQIPSCKMK